jgi:hypothetical protein
MTLEEKINELGYKLGDLVRKKVKSPSEVEEMLRIADAFGEALQRQAQPLFVELADLDIRIKSVWDLVNTSASYQEAIPVLVNHLSRPYHHRNKEGIVRALAVKEAKGLANKAVMKEYLKLPKESPEEPWIFHYRWAFGNTMRTIVTKDDLDELIAIVLDDTNGASRNMFVRALAKLKSPKVRETLEKLVNDKITTVAEEARKALTRKRPAN